MTEKQAWLTIWEAYATPKRERLDKQRMLAWDGICRAILELNWTRVITRDVREDMKRKVQGDARELFPYTAYFCALTPINDNLRADYCYLQYCILGGEPR